MIDPRASMIDSEVDFLKKIIGKNKIIIEVGCYIGKTTCALAENNIVIAIDPFISGFNPKNPTMLDLGGVEETFKSRIKGKNVIWYKKKSEEILKDWKLMIDGVFIDAEHTMKALNIDSGWIKYVKVGGIMAFHDYGCWPDVTSFLQKNIVPKYPEIGRERCLIAFRKQ